ncbi:MAG TPA: PadR family transcriptional regulator [Candidatus Bathyarchaeia archaeon]|nr:PadR family transcriptional regulator [Candidatus Bathyarchaeia archaeon]
MRRIKKKTGRQPPFPAPSFVKPQGVPRGFLRQYLLKKISEKPVHGYDLLRDIETKTEGAWRPGAGSIYPILKELVREGLIKAEAAKKSGRSQLVYHVTQEGTRILEGSGDMLMHAGKNWEAMRSIMMELIEPRNLPTVFPHMVAGQFNFVRQMMEMKKDKIPKREVEFMLKEYALNLERQLDWTKHMLKQA